MAGDLANRDGVDGNDFPRTLNQPTGTGPEDDDVEGLILNSESVRTLRDLGLGEYEIRTVAALVKLGTATIREIMEGSTVPRTKIYETVKTLEDKGWVQRKRSRPMRVRMRPIGEILEGKRREMKRRLASLEAEVEMIQSMDASEIPQLVIMTNMSELVSKIRMVIERAREEIFIFFGFGLEGEMEVLERALTRAVDRGVHVRCLLRPEHESVGDLLRGIGVNVRTLPIPFFKVTIVDWERAIMVTGRIRDGEPLRSSLVGRYNHYPDFITMIRNQMEMIWSREFYRAMYGSIHEGRGEGNGYP